MTLRACPAPNPNPIHTTFLAVSSTVSVLLLLHLIPHHTVTMPREISDIKNFIEICRRKDASCT
jgi:Ribosomal L38e protein family